MSIYKKFFSEELDSNGRIVSFSYHYPSSFNFAYDVVDEIARTDGKKRAIVWTNAAGEEKIIDFRTLKEESDKRASLFLSLGVKKMMCLIQTVHIKIQIMIFLLLREIIKVEMSI